jgi:protein-tyrosine phosphatase
MAVHSSLGTVPRRSDGKVAVCFVCLGNICRSPQAEGLFARHVERAGLAHRFEIDSAGTSGWHVGELPDPRTRATSARLGVVLDSRSRPVVRQDFARFDFIVAMDLSNIEALMAMADSEDARGRISLLRNWDADADGAEVPDPYYGEGDGFAKVFAMCDTACAGLLAAIITKAQL